MIAEWPIAVLVLCAVTVVVCTLAGLLVGNLPDFSEPLMVSPYRQYVSVNKRKSTGRLVMRSFCHTKQAYASLLLCR